MKNIVVILLTILLVGCSSSRVVLSTPQPTSTVYDLSFRGRLVNQVDKKNLNLKETEAEYEIILNKSLENDPNTKKCSVIKDSFRYFGTCCAVARVSCKNPIKFEETQGRSYRSGQPIHFYTIKK